MRKSDYEDSDHKDGQNGAREDDDSIELEYLEWTMNDVLHGDIFDDCYDPDQMKEDNEYP